MRLFCIETSRGKKFEKLNNVFVTHVERENLRNKLVNLKSNATSYAKGISIA